MPRDLFGEVTSPRPTVNGRRWYTVPLSLLAHIALMVPIVLAPLLATDVLPTVRELDVFVSDSVIPPEPPRPPAPVTPNARPRMDANAAPVEAPDHIAPEPAQPFATFEPFESGVIGGVPGETTLVTETPPPPPTPSSQQPVLIGGDVRRPNKIRDVPPVYPPLAQAARVQGMVIVQATIGVDGKVQDLKILRSVPLLDQAAMDAVRQWQYTPTLLNKIPVPVIMTVTVTFTLNQH